MQQNGLIRGIRLISKIMTSQPCEQTVVIHILANISRSKGSQTMKLGYLIDYNLKNIFIKKLNTKYCRKISARP